MLLVGVVLAIVLDAGHARAVRVATCLLVVPAVGFVLAILVMVPEFGAEASLSGEQPHYTLGLPFVGLSTVVILGFLATNQGASLTRALTSAPLSYTGRISYALYLWHFPITFT